jgi:hypothetical protein
MNSKDIENLCIEELQLMAEDSQTSVPKDFSERLQDIVCAISLSEKGLEALVDRDDAPNRSRRHIRWIWVAVPAAAIVAIILFLKQPHQPKDTFTDPTLAYIELTRAFSMFSEALKDIDEPVFSQESK